MPINDYRLPFTKRCFRRKPLFWRRDRGLPRIIRAAQDRLSTTPDRSARGGVAEMGRPQFGFVLQNNVCAGYASARPQAHICHGQQYNTFSVQIQGKAGAGKAFAKTRF
jgi:hypothetical protein